ncbi:hypothetical protein MVEG_05115 [Podila verticillata NRRL 6337]|nr:hypothetical protein MVEG_05115 [Podila verticillata NRRL 6337]
MTFDILTRLPVELAYQILSKLSITDVVVCQSVSRQWYWITTDQSIWKQVYLEHERPYAIPRSALVPSLSTPSATSSSSSTSSLSGYRDWKQHCQSRVVLDRNWRQGDIQSLLTLRYHRGGIVRLRIKAGLLLSGDMFGQVAVWDTDSYACQCVVEAAVGPIQLLDFSAKAMVMTVISRSGVCRIWSIKTKELICSFSAYDVVCMTMDDDHLVLGGRDGRIQVVDFMTGAIVRTTTAFAEEILQDIYIQNDTLIIATGHHLRILSIDTLQILSTCPLPIAPSVRTFCSVFHIRSLILLTEEHLLHIEWKALYGSINKNFVIDQNKELPPNLLIPPRIQKTKVPPISTITSIAIGGNHPRVLTTNADRPSLHDTIRLCPAPRLNAWADDICPSDAPEATRTTTAAPSVAAAAMRLLESAEEETGSVLSSQVPEVAQYLETCGLKPSFMDVDEDVIVIGTSKGDIVVLNMLSLE